MSVPAATPAQAAERVRERDEARALQRTSSEMGAKLEARALACRIAGTVFYELPRLAQDALYGIAAELDDAAAAVAARDRLAEALQEIEGKQQKTLAMIQHNGFVFDDIGNEPGNWQHMAFTIYTDLCEVDSIARAALDDAEIDRLQRAGGNTEETK